MDCVCVVGEEERKEVCVWGGGGGGGGNICIKLCLCTIIKSVSIYRISIRLVFL